MRYVLFLALFTFLTTSVLADCAGSAISFWPSGQTLKQNPVIVINGYAESQTIINGLNKEYAIYLKSGKEKIKLNVKEILTGEFFVTQAVLTPEKNLTEGKDYQLFIDGLPEYEGSLRKWNEETQQHDLVKWTVVKGTDVIKPLWKERPKEFKKTMALYGCGTEKYVHFGFRVSDESTCLIRTTVKSIKTQKKTTYLLEPDDNVVILVGHGMCSGAFVFKDGDIYEVSFDVMDASGNLTVWDEKKIQFTSPNGKNLVND
jgi:hypothetical protein